MAYTKQQIVTSLSVMFLVVLTAVAAYALHKVRSHALPISYALIASTLALPSVAGISVQTATALARNASAMSKTVRNPSVFIALMIALVIYDTTIFTISMGHIVPTRSMCFMDEAWTALFRKKSSGIQRIQDAYNCCGRHNTHDQAWPFPSRDQGVDACERVYQRTKSCFGSWSKEEQTAAALLLVVAVLVFIWTILVLFAPAARLQNVSAQTVARYQAIDNRYTDIPPAEEEDEESEVPEPGRMPAPRGRGHEASRVQLAEDQASWQTARP